MINFPCKCGHPFSVPADQAGGLIQCPVCGLLADVPTLSDLQNINPDGTFAFEDPLPPADDVTAADLHHVFTNKTTDSRGVEKDLRPKPEYIEAIGVEDEIQPRPAPRYDPVTGELIRPLQFKDETPVPVLSIGELVDPSELLNEPEPEPAPLPVLPIPTVPQPKPRSLGYAVGDTRKQVTLTTLSLELLMPANTAVMFFVFLLYVLGYYMTMGVATYVERFVGAAVWPFLIVNVPMWLVLSHIGCVIEDTGPDAVDELPRPLRNFSLGEDILTPLFRTLLAGIICFWPMVLAIRALNPLNPMAMPIVLLLGCAGAFFFPAVLLTAITGTTVLNLRPDRVAAVIKLCGPGYFISIILFVLAIIPSIYYLAGELLFRQQLNGLFFHKIDSPPLMLPIMMCAIYFAHFFAWHLGLMYRQNHDQFPWLAQRHIRKNEIRITNR
jgi:hypothetical protein